MRSYALVFQKKAEREWNKLGATIRLQFTRKLAERLANPKVAKDHLSGYPDLYKIKLKKAGYRLIYRVEDDRLLVIVIKIGQRERGEAYDDLDERLADME